MELKTIDIQGKPYVTVNERVRAFHEIYMGDITTELLTPVESVNTQGSTIVVKATVTMFCKDGCDTKKTYTAYSQEIVGDGYINKSSALENCETSAVGRALGFAGIGIVESIASADEINKAVNRGVMTDEVMYEPVKETTLDKPWEKWEKEKDMCPKCNIPKVQKKDKTGYYCPNLCWKKGDRQDSLIKAVEEQPPLPEDEIPF